MYYLLKNKKMVFMILNGSAVSMTYLFLLAIQIPSATLNMLQMGNSRALADLYVIERNAKVNISLKGNQYLLFKDNLNFKVYCINVSKLYCL